MPLIRYTYEPDVRQFGDKPVVVEDVEARVLLEMRRAVPVDSSELESLTKAELADVAEQVGAEVPKRGAKGQFIKAVTDAVAPPADEAGEPDEAPAAPES